MQYPKIFPTLEFELDEDAEKAQELFEKWLKENGKVVYGSVTEVNGLHFYGEPSKNKLAPDTHKAIIICVESLETCEHKNVKTRQSQVSYQIVYSCSDCGKELVPTGFKEA